MSVRGRSPSPAYDGYGTDYSGSASEAEEEPDRTLKNKGDAESNADAVEAAPRRRIKPRPKLDSNRLLSANGFKYLCRNVKTLRFKGKGHEVSDLRQILQFYGDWAHQLYPKLPLRDFCLQTETVCAQKRMRIHISRWRNKPDDLVYISEELVDTSLADDDPLPPPPSDAAADFMAVDLAANTQELSEVARANREMALARLEERRRRQAEEAELIDRELEAALFEDEGDAIPTMPSTAPPALLESAADGEAGESLGLLDDE